MAKRSNNLVYLSEEIVIQILKNLPSKSLLRFRCVSIDWLRIIDDPYFVDGHRARSHTRPGGIQLLSVMDRAFRSCILSDPTGNFGSILENPLPDITDHRRIMNVEGLICSDHRIISNAEALICFGNCIWNPSTRETMYIPPIKNCVNTMPMSRDNLLGFDVFTNKYKVLCCLNCSARIVDSKNVANQLLSFQVLTLGESSWKILFIPKELRQGFEILSSRSFSNMIFCLIRCGINKRFGVLTFDVQRERVGFISFPHMFKYREDADLAVHITEIDGRLAFKAGVERILWVLNHEIAEWTKMGINLAGCSPFHSWYRFVQGGHNYLMTSLITVGTIHTNEILFQCDVVREDSIRRRFLKYLYYDPKTTKIRFVPKLQKTVGGGICDYVMIKHVDSVVRLNSPT